MLGLYCRQVQDKYWKCRVYGLCNSNVFDDGECKRGVGMLDLSGELKFTEL